MGYSAVLVDMDGVIIDTQQAITRFWQNVARKHNVNLSAHDFAHHIYGCPATHTLSTLFSHLTVTDKDAVLSEMQRIEAQMTYTAMDGAVPLLDQLQEHAIPTALVTSADPWKVNAVFSQLPLSGKFTAQVIGTDIERGKPDPDCYLRAAELLHARPDRCIVLEDAVSGVRAAAAAGAFCIGVQTDDMAAALMDAGAKCVVADLKQIMLRRGAQPPGGRICELVVGTTCTLCLSLRESDAIPHQTGSR